MDVADKNAFVEDDILISAKDVAEGRLQITSISSGSRDQVAALALILSQYESVRWAPYSEQASLIREQLESYWFYKDLDGDKIFAGATSD